LHKNSKADITLIYNDEKENSLQLKSCTVLEVDANCKILGIEYRPQRPKTSFASMDMLIIERELLIDLVEECTSKGQHDFTVDVLLKNQRKLKIYGWKFDGYVGRVDSVNAYYHNNINVLNKNVRAELFDKDDVIYTKTSNQAPTRYGDSVIVKKAMIADGCVIDGRVENSIISRGVHIDKKACVKNSIVMENTHIEVGCNIRNAIIDKECIIKENCELSGHENHPVIIRKGEVL